MLKLKVQLYVHPLLAFALRTFATLACAVILFAAPLAFAQAAQAPDAGTSLQGDIDAVAQNAQSIIHVAQDPTSPWYLTVLVSLFMLCQLFKRFGHRVPVVGVWLVTHPWGDWVVGVALSLLGAMVGTITAHKGVDLGLIISAVVAGMASTGMPLNIFGPSPLAPPPSDANAKVAGAVAAANPGKTLNG